MPRAEAIRLAPLAGFLALGAVTLLGFAAPFLPASFTQSLGPWLEAVRATPWSPLAAIIAFAFFAALGTPQIVLITALVAVFGPWAGLVYAWTGKMIACSIGFFVGRKIGAAWVAQHAGPRALDLMQRLAKRGILVSALIRLVPTVPSVSVNIAAGATPMRFRDFIIGAGIGSLPKMALLAFGGAAAIAIVQKQAIWAWAVLAIVVMLWLTLAYVGRRWLKRATPSE